MPKISNEMINVINDGILRAVIYARYSCERQTEQSIEGQLADCRKYAERCGFQVVDTYIDRATTATNDNRADFQRMIKDSKKQLFDVIIVWKLDRFARNKYDSAVYKRNLKNNGVRVVSAMENIPNTPEGVLMESVLEGFAEYFSLDLAQKVKRGMRETAKKHKITGVIPFGYTRSPENTYIPDPKNSLAVKKVFKMYLAGESKTDIAAWLNNHGFRTAYGNLFTKDSITPIVQNTRYIGRYKYNDLEIYDENQRIIDDDTFYSVQKKVHANQRTGAMTRARERFLLTGKLYCGDCKNKFHGESAKSRNSTIHYYYTCAGRKKLHICTHQRIKKDDVETFVLNSVKKLLSSKQIKNAIANTVSEIQSASNSQVEAINALEMQLKDANKRISNIMNAIEQGIISPTTQNRLKELENLRYRLEYEISEKRSDNNRFSKSQILDYFNRFDIENATTWQDQQIIIQHFVDKVYLWEDRILILFNFITRKKTSDTDADLDVENISKKILDEQFYCSSNKEIGSPIYLIDEHFYLTECLLLFMSRI